MATVSHRTFFCQACRRFTRLALPTKQRSCGHCGNSFISLYQEGDFKNTSDPSIITNWLSLTKSRFLTRRLSGH